VRRIFLATLLLSACNWVGQSNIDERLLELDDDGDGFTRDGGGDAEKVDCDDGNRDIYPGADEIWYDGVDQDCAGNDDYDQDADGFRSEAESMGYDCDDLNAAIYPAANDDWYDGVDSDCAGNDDYDQDADGYRSEAEAEDGDDCDDLEASTYPSAPDAWYDGVDSDCAGNDDFDQDGDGFRSQAETSDGDDCDDLDLAIYPGAPDDWYDGVDSDCVGNDDYDQDGDGHQAADQITDGDDCLDTNAEAYPGALEQLSDTTIDHDCDGAGDSIKAWWDSSMSWEGIGSIHMGKTSTRLYLSLVSDSFTNTNGTVYYDLGAALHWDPASPESKPSGVEFWTNTYAEASAERAITSGHDILFEDDYLYGVMALIDSSTINRTARLNRLDLSNQSIETAAASTNFTSDLVDFTLFRDAQNMYRIIGCDPTGSGSFVYLLTNDDYLDNLGGPLHQALIQGTARAESCVAQDRGDNEPHFYYQNGLDNDALELSYLDTSTNDLPSLTINYNSVNQSVAVRDLDYIYEGGEDWLVLTDSLASQIRLSISGATFTLTTGFTPDAIDLATDPANNRVIFAWTDLNGGASIGWADATGILGSAVLNTSLHAKDIALIVPDNGDKVMVIIMADNGIEMAVAHLP
jgi:hypothetical protein